MGAVYRATAASGEVAVKILNADAMGQETSQRFLRESELVRRLKHPHVVRTLDSGVDSATGLMFLVMPLLKGRDLDRVLEELGALEPETAVRIALQASRGLSAAHRIGIIHRDVKPGNLILDEEDNELVVRVCDFGIAKQVGSENELTTTGSQLGTPDYVSPEQLKSSKHVDERADVWSLGATLYQMLCGAPPYAHIDSVFDLITFGTLLCLRADAPAFRTAWFVESLLSEVLILLVIRTRRSLFRSPPSGALLGMCVGASAVAVAIPWIPDAAVLGFAPLSPVLAAATLAIVVAYVAATELVKRLLGGRELLL